MANKLKKAIQGLHDEINKLDPASRKKIQGHLNTIRSELSSVVGGVLEPTGVSEPHWIGGGPPMKTGKK